ncbi:hypothetical protein DET59_12548 [Rossellomorea aquimaris]|uniref:Uncharacterized protein n=1 Tax=Rossellomorea aquimaris TaxID=189382 RepID=A0A366ECV2_9BACI|nr:hypothetical protein DET59_12548 [Rossellomorea aquimaris]
MRHQRKGHYPTEGSRKKCSTTLTTYINRKGKKVLITRSEPLSIITHGVFPEEKVPDHLAGDQGPINHSLIIKNTTLNIPREWH